MARFAREFAIKLYDCHLIESSQIDEYAYAVETEIIKVLGWSVLLLVALFIGCFFEILCYLIFFSAIRKYGGGVHLNSICACLGVSVLSIFIPVLCYALFSITKFLCLCGVLIALIISLLVGSVNNAYIAWDEHEYIQAKMINRIIASVETVLILVLLIIDIHFRYVVFMMMGFLSASFAMLMDYYIKKGGKWGEEVRDKIS